MPKILLVEDNEANREMLSYRLKRREYKLLTAVDGAEAVSLAAAEKPDLILMDLSLPIMNGWEATKQIKANPNTKNIPVIALTAHAMSGDRQKALEAGCDDYDSKPIDFSRLIDKMKALLERNSSSQLKQVATRIESIKSNTQPKSAVEPSTLQLSDTAEPLEVDVAATKILLVEDNEANRKMLSYRLRRRKYELLIAVDGAEAVSLAAAEEPDLILMDLSLPIMNGWDATKQIKANPNTKNIPIIALTAHAMIGDRQTALEAGCDDYDSKPIDFSRLIDKMMVLLEPKSQLQPEETTSTIDSVETKTQPQLTLEEQLEPEPSELLKLNVVEPLEALRQNLNSEKQQPNLFQEETELLQLKEMIKVVYSPVGKRNWRTGSMVKLSKKRAEINSKKTNLISPKTKIEIRFFISGNLKLGERIYAEVSEIPEQSKEYFLVKFSSQYDQITELLKTVV